MSDQKNVSLDGNDLDLDVEQPDEYQIIVEFPDEDEDAWESTPGTRGLEPEPGPRAIPGAGRRGVSATQIEERSQQAIQAAMSTIREMALQTDLMRQGIPGGSQPRMIKIKFGVKLDFEVGAILAKSSAGATMEVELEWARRSDDVLRVLRAETDVEQALFTSSFAADYAAQQPAAQPAETSGDGTAASTESNVKHRFPEEK